MAEEKIRAKVRKTKGMLVGLKLQQVFQQWSLAKGNRDGLHASSVLASEKDFCWREHILEQGYRKNEVELSTWTLRIYLNGWFLHQKWQQLFQDSGIAESVEMTRISPKWNLQFTPDAVVRLFGRSYIVEIKSMNTREFQGLKSPPAHATRQANLYMHLTGIPYAIVLVEDKNNQDVKSWVIEYDAHLAAPYVHRLYTIRRLIEIWGKDGRVPKRICANENVARARRCPMREACFAEKEVREGMRLVSMEKDTRVEELQEMVRISVSSRGTS